MSIWYNDDNKIMRLKLSNGKTINLIPIIAIVLILVAGFVTVSSKKFSCKNLEEAGARPIEETVEDLVYFGEDAVALADSFETENDSYILAQAAFVLINDERKSEGLAPLRWAQELEEPAKIRARELYDEFSHTRPDNSLFWSVAPAYAYGETVSKGYRSADKAMEGWMESDVHKSTLMSPDYGTISISIYEAEDGNRYWEVLLGR